jgi:Tfp pilus assembly protein PilF
MPRFLDFQAWACALLLLGAAHSSANENSVRQAYHAAERAVKADPNNASAHLDLAIAAGELTDFVDNSTKMALSKQIRDEASRAIALNPDDDMAYHVLGRWNFGIATLNPVLRLAARMAYGNLPAASKEEAARLLEKAAALAPQKIMHHQHLALVYEAMGAHDKAARQWKIVLALPVVESDDHAARKEARKALGMPPP